ncbi:hypothetical protein Tco_0235606, partial [Tanacetum coccineum]
MPLLAAMLPPAQAAISDDGTGEVAPDAPQTIPETIQETRPEPDHSFSIAHESDPDLFTSTNVEDETLGGSFHTTPRGTSSSSWPTSHIHPSLSKEISHYCLRQWLCDIVRIAAETVCFVRFESFESSESFEYSFETQMLVQRLTQRTQ